jgi:hypothetical protein
MGGWPRSGEGGQGGVRVAKGREGGRQTRNIVHTLLSCTKSTSYTDWENVVPNLCMQLRLTAAPPPHLHNCVPQLLCCRPVSLGQLQC